MKIPRNKHGELIKRIKYLRDPKYYKNNVWSLAAGDSWAARGEAGGCSYCSHSYYNGHLENKRAPKKEYWEDGKYKSKSGEGAWMGNEIIDHLCHSCIGKIEEIIGYEFQTR